MLVDGAEARDVERLLRQLPREPPAERDVEVQAAQERRDGVAVLGEQDAQASRARAVRDLAPRRRRAALPRSARQQPGNGFVTQLPQSLRERLDERHDVGDDPDPVAHQRVSGTIERLYAARTPGCVPMSSLPTGAAVVEADELDAPVAAHERGECAHEGRVVDRHAPLRDDERLRRIGLVEVVRPHERPRAEVVVVVPVRVEEARAREVVAEAVAADRRFADRERVPDHRQVPDTG